MNIKSKLALLPFLITAMGGDLDNLCIDNSKSNLTPQDIDVKPKEKPIPKGCQRYYFNENGFCSKSESIVSFDAMKPEKANDKYQRWLLNKNL